MGFIVNILSHPGVLPVVGAAGMWLAQKALGARRWKWVQRRAKEILGDRADPITNPEEAVKKALAEAMRAEIEKRAEKLRRAKTNNGAH